jgi:hypothetical protein
LGALWIWKCFRQNLSTVDDLKHFPFEEQPISVNDSMEKALEEILYFVTQKSEQLFYQHFHLRNSGIVPTTRLVTSFELTKALNITNLPPILSNSDRLGVIGFLQQLIHIIALYSSIVLQTEDFTRIYSNADLNQQFLSGTRLAYSAKSSSRPAIKRSLQTYSNCCKQTPSSTLYH